MKIALGVLVCFIFLSPPIYSQEYSYTHYDISDGLAGSTVYCITQDKDGFIWVGTETGVSRFDGTHFRTFTVAEGLPDVEILEMFCDSRGRVWMASFRRSVCYYYQGKIYNQENDSLLSRLRFSTGVDRFAEDSAGDILLMEKKRLHVLYADGTIREIDSINGRPVTGCGAVARDANGQFLVQVDTGIYCLSKQGIKQVCRIAFLDPAANYIAMNAAGMIWRLDSIHAAIRSFETGRTRIQPFERSEYRHNSFDLLDDSLFYFNEFSGVREYNVHTGVTRSFLPGHAVAHTFRDATGNMWFGTLDQGLFRLNSDEFRTIGLSGPDARSCKATSITSIGDQLFVGGDNNCYFTFDLPYLQHYVTNSLMVVSKNTIMGFGLLPSGHLYIATGQTFFAYDHGKEHDHLDPLGLKSVFQISKDSLLIGTMWGAAYVDPQTWSTDTIWRDRATTVFFRRDTAYIGTLNGLYAIAADRSVTFMGGSVPFLRKRISAIAESGDSTLWIASYDAGVIGYRNGAIIARITREQGLTSDICRTLYIQGNILWIGTDKGLNRVSLDKPGLPVDRFTSQDGLGSNIVNCIYSRGSIVFVGTPAGLSYFDETRLNTSEGCRLFLLSVQNEGRERIGDTAALRLPYTDKHLRVEFAGISYRSVGGVTYRYRLLGLDTTWRTTRETYLEYQTLPAGRYLLQLQATNKFGVQSDMLSLPFHVAAPWWETTWFRILLFLGAVFLTWYFVSLRIRRIRRRQKEREKVNQRMIELEHMALQSQMNPHFIFNCLNSIQQYIFDGNVLSANKYIAGFARLVRSTLQHSSKNFIPLAEEIDYLSGYLDLEKLRFKEKMDYEIQIDARLHDNRIIIPPMLIQPYVENSIRHGLRHKQQGQGRICLQFRYLAEGFQVVVEDNGIGRKKAASLKTREHIEYQSKGMSLTADRIRIINSRYREQIQVEIIDLEEDERPVGTRVIIEFPFFHLIPENESI